MWTLGGFNTADPESATRVLAACCASPVWAEGLAAGRPYDTLADLDDAALAAFDALDDAEIEKAVDAHPRIGGGAEHPVPAGSTAPGTSAECQGEPARGAAAAGGAGTAPGATADDAAGLRARAPGRGPAAPSGPEAEWSRGEQARAMTADAAVRAALADANAAYERRFGRVFLICATGLAAEDILAAARRRLDSDEPTERAVTRAELRKIVALRLGKAFGEDR
ncbi:2-oxo-4-hydroxy-4-carboxy-5-ureidoimidazoline decarboxylase [Glycomyces sp. NPDC047369]